jgi:hypothetical protein
MQTQRLALQISAILATLIMSFQPAWSAAVNPNAARGKKVIYVYNQTKLEKARTAEPTDSKRIAQLESWRKNDEDAMQFLGKPGLGAVIIATVRGEPEKASIFAYEKGATMNGEFLAPARRVSFFLWQDTFDQMRPEGLALFKAAVLWAVSPPE